MIDLYTVFLIDKADYLFFCVGFYKPGEVS
jgi:hypothetical protein